jgi:hypothetical protein
MAFYARHVIVALLGLGFGVTFCGQQFNQSSSGRPFVQIPVLVKSEPAARTDTLSSKDLLVLEDNLPDAVLGLDKIFQATQSSEQSKTIANPKVYVLLVLSPMAGPGLQSTIHSAMKALSTFRAISWQIAIVTPSGMTLPFGKKIEDAITLLKTYEKKVHSPQFLGGQWTSIVNQSIQELFHAIVCVSDSESKVENINKNPWLLQVQPSMFIGQAIRAHAPIYTVQAAGPSAIVPFGSAAESSQYSGPGPYIASVIHNESVGLDQLRSNLLYAASQTGGSPASDIKNAFDRISSDLAGYYLLRFEPKHLEADGTWHPITVSTTCTGFKVVAPHYYQAPISTELTLLHPALQQALISPKEASDLKVTARAWSFPDGHNGTYTMAFSVDVSINPVLTGSDLKFVTELYSETEGTLAGIWQKEITPNSISIDKAGHSSFHWQNEAAVYPGVYILSAAVLDEKTNSLSSVRYRFIAYPFLYKTLLASDVVLSDECFSENHLNLLSPIRLEDCNLKLPVVNSFSETSKINVLLRLYTATKERSDEIVTSGKAYAVISFRNGSSKQTLPMSIIHDEIRGLMLYEKLSPRDFHLSAGNYVIQIFLAMPKLKGPIPLSSETAFSITS